MLLEETAALIRVIRDGGMLVVFKESMLVVGVGNMLVVARKAFWQLP